MNILVTGGASGLGEALTRKLAGDDKNAVFITYCRSEEKAEALKKEFSNVRIFHCDFSKKESVEALVAQMAAMDLDALINNAISGLDIVRFHEAKPEYFLERFQTNVLPVITLTGEAIRNFRTKGKGKIVTILTAMLDEKPPTGFSEYVASKAYLAALSRSWAAENGRWNIAVHSVSPAFMRTELTDKMDPLLRTALAKNAIEPAGVAEVVHAVLSESLNDPSLALRVTSY